MYDMQYSCYFFHVQTCLRIQPLYFIHYIAKIMVADISEQKSDSL